MLGLGISINKNKVSDSGPVYEAEFQAVLDRGTTLGYSLPTDPALTAGNTMVAALKAAGIWNKLDLLYVFATNGDSNFATLNWMNPASFQCTLFNSPTFTSLEGFTGNGSNAYMSTGYNPSTHGVNWQLNSCSLGYYTRNAVPVAVRTEFGVYQISANAGTYSYGASAYAVNSNVLATPVNNTSAGLRHINRAVAGSSTKIVNGGTPQTSTSASSVIPNALVQFLRRSDGVFYSSLQVSLGFVGGDLSSEATTLFNIVEAYMDALGKGVVA